MLDAELDKVETFYIERANEMHERAKMLRKQFDELEVHRQMFYVGTLYCGLTYMPLNCQCDPVRNHPRTRRLRAGPREHIVHFCHRSGGSETRGVVVNTFF